MSIRDWKKLGYSNEQSEELERLSHIGDDMSDIDVHVADKMLQETMKKYKAEKENNIMNKNLGKSLTESLKEHATNFAKWQSASQAILNGCNNLKKMSDSVEEVNDSLVGLEK